MSKNEFPKTWLPRQLKVLKQLLRSSISLNSMDLHMLDNLTSNNRSGARFGLEQAAMLNILPWLLKIRHLVIFGFLTMEKIDSPPSAHHLLLNQALIPRRSTPSGNQEVRKLEEAIIYSHQNILINHNALSLNIYS